MANTREEVIRSFEAEGIAISDWALANGFKPRTVYAVLRGELKGKRGLGHTIAIALGLKDEPREKRFAA